MKIRRRKADYVIGLKSVCLCFLFVLISCTLRAENDTDTSSTPKVGLLFNFDSRNTYIQNKHFNIWGLRAGLSFGKKSHRITLGYYWMGYDATKSILRWHKVLSPRINLASITQTDVQFLSLAYWYPVLKTKKWTLLAPVEFGIGKQSSHYKDFFEDIFMRRKERYFQPFQVGIYAEHKLTPWAGLYVQTGYRNAIKSGNIDHHFGGMYYSYGLSLYPETIYKDLKTWRLKRRKI